MVSPLDTKIKEYIFFPFLNIDLAWGKGKKPGTSGTAHMHCIHSAHGREGKRGKRPTSSQHSEWPIISI